ncbi:minor tail protein [Brochothrix phage BtpYZU03]|nr:minor tail protein [Brochothrix phage BtpYZU03]
MSNISKVAKTKMEITADYQKISDLNVAFYNQDVNTAILQFNVTRNDAPVPLGKTNVEGYIVLLHEDGSRIQDNLEIVDEIKGIIQYTIPKEFLKHTGKVLGQVYVAVKGRDDTAVMRKISFDIKQDLMTGFSAAVKLEYIKTFDDLQAQIKQRVAAIEEAIANGEDYVARMIETLDTGKKEIAATVSKANTDINKVATDAKKNVTVTADTAKKDIASKATEATTDIDKAVSVGQKKITDTSNAATATVTSKAKEVTDAITNNQVVKITDTVNWQKYPMIPENGYRTRLLNGTDVLTLKSGYYEVSLCKNSPYLETEASWKNVDVIESPDGRKDMRLVLNATGNTYFKTVHTNGDGGKDWWQWADRATTQLQKITADNGTPKYDLSEETDLFAEAAKWGNGMHTFYLSAGAANNPTGSTSYVMGRAHFYGNNGGIEAYDKSGKKYYAPRTGKASFGAWKDYSSSDTGWVPYNTANGVKQNLQFKNSEDNGFDCSYRIVTQQGVTTKYMRINAENITASGVTLAKLPADFIRSAHSFSPRTPRNKVTATVAVRANGDVVAITPDNWVESDYLYGSFSWID